MTSGSLTSKPSDIYRKALLHRATKAMVQSGKPVGKLTDTEKKSPSERKSENLRKKLGSRDGYKPRKEIVLIDCRNCPNLPCNLNSNTCTEKLWTYRCYQCGLKVQYRFIEGNPWVYCPTCRAARGEPV